MPAGNSSRRSIIEHKGDLHPQIIVEDATGKILGLLPHPEKADPRSQRRPADHGRYVLVAKTPREATGTQDITGGLPRVTGTVRSPEAEGAGGRGRDRRRGRDLAGEARGKRVIVVHGATTAPNASTSCRTASTLRACTPATTCEAGDAPRPRPARPARHPAGVKGEEAVQQYLLHEVQNVYRAQGVEIDDKHIELILAPDAPQGAVSTMPATPTLRRGSSSTSSSSAAGQRSWSRRRVKVTDAGETEFQEGDVVPLINGQGRAERRGRSRRQAKAKHAKPCRPRPALSCWGSPRRPCRARASSRRASFQETTKVLTEAALAGQGRRRWWASRKTSSSVT